MGDSAFKNWINQDVVKIIAQEVSRHYPEFDSRNFSKVSKNLAPLELKARVLLITEQLNKYLPEDYTQTIEILRKVVRSKKIRGFSLWPISEYIGQFGLDHFDESMQAMYELTQEFTSEFCIRPFILKDHKKVLKFFRKWTKDKNTNVRRWVSEGSRPLLPWGLRIDLFKNDPSYTLPLLEQLKYDEELFVRKSLANHLNDISKHHPEVVIKTLQAWEKDCSPKHKPKIQWIKRHALRTLIKKGNPKALQLMGVKGPAKVKVTEIKITQKKLALGDTLEFNFGIASTSQKKQKLVVDYAIHFVKKNGALSPKVFKLKTLEIPAKATINITKRHSLKKITTMVYNTGKHLVAIQINGQYFKESEFYLNA